MNSRYILINTQTQEVLEIGISRAEIVAHLNSLLEEDPALEASMFRVYSGREVEVKFKDKKVAEIEWT